MNVRWIVMAGVIAAFSVAAADPSLADAKRHMKHHAAKHQCVDRPFEFSWGNFLFGNQPAPRWNGCSPPVYVGGEFVGQDPDPNIRNALRRNPDQGYKQVHW
jgi:hypothetical protein